MGREINQEMTQKEVRERTICDFGNQWQIHGQVDQDYWSSKEMFTDHFGERFDPQEIAGKVVAEVGKGFFRRGVLSPPWLQLDGDRREIRGSAGAIDGEGASRE